MKINLKITVFGLLLLTATGTTQPPSSVSTSTASAGDTLRNVWVFFKDKNDSRFAPVSPRAALRRRKAGFHGSESDRPVNNNYIREVERLGGTLRTVFPWENAASFSVSSSRLAELSALPFVKSVSPVAVYVNRKVGGTPGLSKSARATSKSAAAGGGYDWHTEMVGVPLAHDYIRYKGLGAPGSGVLMAFFDGGFRLDHAVYKRLRDNSQVLCEYDFVDDDTLVSTPDRVTGNPNSPYYQNARHGTQVLSLAAACAPGDYMGTAYGAYFALARTEDDSIEARVEEDYWAAAALWADSVGADIISSSLGYRDDHTDSTENYKYPAMNGDSTIVSKAAAGAVRRGIIVVNAMGNEGSGTAGTITAPADVDGVVSVGAVTQNRTLANFSSTGPTYDNRLKPELVAPGFWVPVPEPYSSDRASYTYVSGTSFSTPLVSAIIALILQTHPGITPEAAKERLYASCRFAYGQDTVNYRFGYGIPNAARAIMDSNEIFLKITDTGKNALAGAIVAMLGGDSTRADSSGNVLIKAQKSALPARLLVSYRDTLHKDTIIVDALPFALAIEMEGKWDNALKLKQKFIRKNGIVNGRYTFAVTDASTPVTVTVCTLTGKRVLKKKPQLRPDGIADFEWNTRGRAAGVYIITIRQGYGVVAERVVVSD
jgi:subtilisin family serine protease